MKRKALKFLVKRDYRMNIHNKVNSLT